MKTSFDVIIAGAGPAGLSCAEGLLRSGLRVLVLERNKEIGPKTCAGGLTPLAGFNDLPPDTVRTFPSQLLQLQTGIGGRKQYRIHFRHPLRTVARPVLARHQLERLHGASHVTILAQTRILEVGRGRIRTDRGDFSFGKLVACDGSRSVIRAALGLPFRFGCGLYYRVPVVTSELMISFAPARLRSGCIWVFPHVDHTNIGVGYNPSHVSTPAAKAELVRFLAAQGYTRPIGSAIRGAQLGYLYSGFDFDPVFLAGDAAGLVSKATGEGISAAIISGREVAARIVNPSYGVPELKRIIRMKRRQEALWGFLEAVPPLQSLLMRGFFALLESGRLRTYFGNVQSNF